MASAMGSSAGRLIPIEAILHGCTLHVTKDPVHLNWFMDSNDTSCE